MPEQKVPKLNDFIPPNLTVSNSGRKLHHVFNEDDCYALWAAYSAGRPLLVRGKPGTGKSQMAKAIAEQLGWAFVSEVIHGSTELSDLHCHFDAIGRLGEAQARSMGKDLSASGCSATQDRLNPLHFLSPGVFWWAYDWQAAAHQYQACYTRLRPEPLKPDATTPQGKTWQPETGGVVLLLDEIDKAEPDLPNGLLETLGQYRFSVPYLHDTQQADPSRVLVVITTNEERELPSAFVRRCFVHTLKMEESPEKIMVGWRNAAVEKRHAWLVERGKLHFGSLIADTVYLQAAEQLWIDRESDSQNRYPPGLAEYIDLLSALQSLDKAEQQTRLNKIARYALKKEVDG
jgi:MoxR-like ATPase